jgi:hypothetical protein
LTSASSRTMSGGQRAERDPGRNGRRHLVHLVQLAPGGLDRSGQGVDDLVGQVGGLAGEGLRSRSSAASRAVSAAWAAASACLIRAAAVFRAGLGTTRPGSSGPAA